jgi:carbamoyltransferase
MVICGIKLSHDAGIALIEDDRVLFSIEVEKLENNPRYSSMGGLGRVARMLEAEGLKTSDVDQFVVDGWFVAGVDDTEVRDPASTWAPGGSRLGISVAPNQNRPGTGEPLARYFFRDHVFSPSTVCLSADLMREIDIILGPAIEADPAETDSSPTRP